MFPVTIFSYLFTAILPVFYFALFRNEGTARFPKRVQPVAIAGVLSLGLFVVTGLPDMARSLGAYWTAIKTPDWTRGAASVLTTARAPGTIGAISTILAELSNLAVLLPLIAFFRNVSDEQHMERPVSRFLNLATTAAVIAWGLFLAVNALRLFAMPFVYFQLRNFALQNLGAPPRFWSMEEEPIRELLLGVGLCAAPYIVYTSRMRPVEEEDDCGAGSELSSDVTAVSEKLDSSPLPPNL